MAHLGYQENALVKPADILWLIHVTCTSGALIDTNGMFNQQQGYTGKDNALPFAMP